MNHPRDDRAKGLTDASLRCRQRRMHPIVDLIDALTGAQPDVCHKTVDGTITTIQRACLTKGCGVLVIDSYDAIGRHVSHSLKYPKDEDGNDTYLLPPGSGRLHPEDAAVEIWARYGGKGKGRRR